MYVQIGKRAFNPERLEDTVCFERVDHYEPNEKGGLTRIGKVPGVTLCHGDHDQTQFTGKELVAFTAWWAEQKTQGYVIEMDVE